MVDLKDVDVLRFLWWFEDDLFKWLVDFRMMVYLFGSIFFLSCVSFGLWKIV